MKRLALLLLLYPSIALAADKTAYITTGCANNGNGTSASCAGSPGGAGAWNSCANAITGEVAANANLTTLGGHLILMASGTTAESANCTINGFGGMDATHKLKLIGDWSTGVWNTSQYRFDAVLNGGSIIIRDPYVEIRNVQIKNQSAGSGSYYGIYADSGGGSLDIVVKDCLLIGGSGTTGGTAGMYLYPNAANARLYVINNIMYGYTGADNIGYALYGSGYNNGEIIVAYNNVQHGAPTGFTTHGGGSSDAQYIKNNIAQSNSTAGYALSSASSHTTSTTATNLSEDTSSPNNTWDSLAVTFVSETGGSEDLHLAAGDTAAKDQGTDLSGDGQYAFSTDIDAATRSGTWDIGPDELTSAAGVLLFLNASGEN